MATESPGDIGDRVAIVTGASRGIGHAIAVGLVAAGARVLLVGRDQAALELVASTMSRNYGQGRVAQFRCDLTEPGAAGRVVAAAFDTFGRAEILVNNAALGQRYIKDSALTSSTRFWESDPERIADLIATNVTAPFLLATAITPHLIERGWGRIINLTTSLGTMQRPLNSPYGPSKAALEVATLIWSQELAGTGVTVNTILPGRAVDTGMVLFATGALLPPEVMVPVTVWLASNASDGTTGARFIASRWDPTVPPEQAARAAREDPVLRSP